MARAFIPKMPLPPTPEALAERRLRAAAKRLGLNDLGQPDQRLYADTFTRPIVYAWMRGEECLYVGMSSRGLARLYERHHVIKDIGPDDVLFVWNLYDVEGARRIEGALIVELRPKLNIRGNPDGWDAEDRRAGRAPEPEAS